MGQSAVSGHSHTDHGTSDDVSAFLDELETQLPALGAQLRTEISSTVAGIGEPSAERVDDLAQQVQVLAHRAAAHRFALVAEELGVCEAVLLGGHTIGADPSLDLEQIDEALRRIAAFVTAERQREATPTSGPVGTFPVGARPEPRAAIEPGTLQSCWALQVPPTVLVVGPPSVAESLQAHAAGPGADRELAGADEGVLEVECVTDSARAIDVARALGPDVIVVDADLDGSASLVASLVEGPLTAAAPVIAVGTWQTAEEAAPLVDLGAVRTLPKPVSATTLQRACLEVAANPASPQFEPIGTTTLDDLGQRLVDELHRGLCDAADDKSRALPVAVGPGSDVLAALWGAIARIRELVTARSGGQVQFVPTGPEGALPAASWLTSGQLRVQTDRAPQGHEVRRASPELSLQGRTIVVAEDDLSVNWFLVGVLREAGAVVHEARDGAQALALAYQHGPDLVISDILMPELDGFSLCRAFKRDVALRDVPVILLSWKEDLLQRVRELGAGAEGYLRKEASSATIVRRVAEVLQPRSQIAARLAAGGPVRGRLDGLTAVSLLGLVCRHRPDATLTVRDALFLYEVEVREGRPVSATRTAADGETLRGDTVMAALLGVGLGRFGVIDGAEPVGPELSGTLEEQLVEPVARTRAALSLVAGPALLEVVRVTIDPALAHAYVQATPQPMRGLLDALSQGASPRDLLASGRASSQLLESALGDAARHGAIREVWCEHGDALAAAVNREQRVLGGIADEDTARSSLLAQLRAVSHFDARAQPLGGSSDEVAGALPLAVLGSVTADPGEVDIEGTDTPPPYASGPDGSAPLGLIANSGARFRRQPPAAPARITTPIWASGMAVADSGRAAETSRGDSGVLVEPAPLDPAPPAAAVQPSAPVEAPAPSPPEPSSAPAPGPALAPASPPAEPAPPAPAPAPAEPALAPPSPPAEPAMAPAPDEPPAPRIAMPSAYATGPRSNRERPTRNRYLLPIVFGLVGVSLAVGARWWRERSQVPEPPPVVAAPAQPGSLSPTPNESTTPSEAPAGPQATATANGDLPQELPLTKDDQVGAGEGLLEIVAGRNDEIHVNGKLVGKGPVVKVALRAVPDPYEVRVKLRGEERVRYAVVKEGKRTRLRVAPPWSR